MSENWLPVPGWRGSYEVSDLGKVRSLDRFRGNRFFVSRMLSPEIDTECRPRVTLKQGRRFRRYRVHILVLLAFVSTCPEGEEGCHNDGNPKNNRVDNLRWDTKRGNAADRLRHGTHTRRERQPLHKLTTAQVAKIRQLYRYGDGFILARRFGVSHTLIIKLVNTVT